MHGIAWTDCEAITFDCYGTLVDWEAGILETLRPLFDAHRVEVTDERLLARYADHEARIERASYRPYREVLVEVARGLAADFGLRLGTPAEATLLADSLPRWPLFPDTVEALGRLAERYRLGILSNVDDDLFAATAERLPVSFEWVVTAEQVGAYKPSTRNFEALLDRVDVAPGGLVHAAQSLFHDVAPARELGLPTVWVDRRGSREGGATPGSRATPELRVASLSELADIACDAS